MLPLTATGSIVVARTPEDVWDLLTDIGRTGEWSPQCRACWWDDGAGPTRGAWFTGRNETPTRTWETRSQVVVAERPREFAWLVGGAWVRWGYQLEPVPEGTRVVESWAFLPEGLASFRERYGDDADTQIAVRAEAAHEGIPVTLRRLKQVAER